MRVRRSRSLAWSDQLKVYICVAFSLNLQRAFQVIELRQEAEELVRLLLRWVTEGKAGFGPPHYTTLINTVRTHNYTFRADRPLRTPHMTSFPILPC